LIDCEVASNRSIQTGSTRWITPYSLWSWFSCKRRSVSCYCISL